ncbi:MAG: hypothetical protein ACYTGP_10600 [Planctomycetota bacterium]
MRPEDLLRFTRRAPFTPFRICMSDGTERVVRHPDQIIVLRSRATIAVAAEGEIPDHEEHLALVHIVRVEEMAA